ncbi:MAG: DUF4340 domain-containing protein [Melioribacteraceae bacterium]|nr:DUF4340 domain-containing protein [Melioribacteraceae bacterium]
MFNKISNKSLIVVFAVLLIFVLVITFSEGSKQERSFRQNLVDIDTSKVSKIVIHPKTKNEEIKLVISAEGWKVETVEGKSYSVPKIKIENIFNSLSGIKSKRLASRDEKRWSEFQVDSAATRVQVYEGSIVALDIILGRFSFQQPRTMNTFVRLANDTDVYEVEGFFGPTFDQGSNSFRESRVIKDDYNNWNKLTFDYPADSSFQMIKVDNKWTANGVELDSAKTVQYLRKIQNLNENNFEDESKSELLADETHKLTIDSSEKGQIIVKARIDELNNVVSSTQNNEAIFDGKKGKLSEKVFVGLKSLK